MKVGILGGGLAGLTLGKLLRCHVEILEKETECGGLMRSLRKNGFTFDYGGSHIIFSKNKATLKFIFGILGENKIRNKRNTKVLYNGCYVKYPFENWLSDLPLKDNFECLYHFIQNLIKKEKGELKTPINLKEWCYYTFGSSIAEKYLIPYNEKIWKYPLEKISLDWVKRIPCPPAEDVIKASLGLNKEGYVHQLYFYYPKKGGIQAIIKSLERDILKSQKKYTTNFSVTHIEKAVNKWIVANEHDRRVYDKIISTIPIFELANSMDNIPAEILKCISNLKYNSLITVMAGLDAPKVSDLSWLYLPQKNTLVHRVSFPSNYSPFTAPKNKSSILAEITCQPESTLWNGNNRAIEEQVIKELDQLNIIDMTDVEFTVTRKTKYAYVINDHMRSENVRKIKEYFKSIGIPIIGRFSEFEYLNMDNSITHAMGLYKKLRGEYN